MGRTKMIILILIGGWLFSNAYEAKAQFFTKVDTHGYWAQGDVIEGTIGKSGNMEELVAGASPESIVYAVFISDSIKRETQILRTKDGGLSWETIYVQENTDKDWELELWTSIKHPDEQTIGALAEMDYGRKQRPVFIYSTDGGENYEILHSERVGGMVKGVEAINVSMYDDQHWAFTTHRISNTYLHVTQDGGKNWRTEEFNSSRGLQVQMRSEKKINLFSLPATSRDEAATFISNDGGQSWEEFPGIPPDASNIAWEHGVEFVNEDVAFIGGREATVTGDIEKFKIFKTEDAGREWELVFDDYLGPDEGGSFKGVLDISFANEQEGLAFGGFGRILRTRDGGETWVSDSSTTDISNDMNTPIGLFLKADSVETGLMVNQRFVAIYQQTDYYQSEDNATGFLQKGSDAELQAYPQPAQDKLQVDWQGQQSLDAVIYDMKGQVKEMVTLPNGNTETIDVSDWSPGLYFLLNTGDGPVVKQKLLIE